MRIYLTKFLLAGFCWLALADTTAYGAITNATPVNVTPSGFSVVWRARADSVASISVFADAAGVTNLAGKVGIEAFPLHTGNPVATTGYDRRLSRAALRQKTQEQGLVMMRVTGGRPNTTYYYRVSSKIGSDSPEVFPVSGPLPSVTTPRENTFVVNHQQLILEVADLNPEGRIVMLTHTNAPYALAAVIGDGVGTNQVFFDANNLFLQAGGGNFAALGSQEFGVDVMGQSDITQRFALNFTASFVVAQSTLASLGTEFFAASVGSTITLFGDAGVVAINGNSSAALTGIDIAFDIPPGHLSNLTFQATAPELSTTLSTMTPQGGSAWLLRLTAQTGQSFLGNKALGEFRFYGGPLPSSAFVPLRVTGVTATKLDASSLARSVAQSGRVVVIGNEPLVEALRAADGSRSVTLYGKPNAAFALETTDTVAVSNSWKLLTRVPMTNLTFTLPANQPLQPAQFYRAYEFQADPPMLEGRLAADGTRSILLYGKPNTTYALEYKTNLVGATTWQSWTNVPLVHSFTTFPATAAGNPNVFYRAY
jgi:hypothetical protein